MNDFKEYLKKLAEEKWVIIHGRKNGNCQHPTREHLTCGEYEKTVWIVPAQGNRVPVPASYAPREGLWICPEHLSNYEIKET